LRETTPSDMREWARLALGSPLYSHLAGLIADTPELLRVLNRMENRPRANVFLAAVHYLLMVDSSHELARFYGSLVEAPRSPVESDRPFTDFVLAQEERIAELGSTRYTQTNECRRCVALLPAIWETSLDRFHIVDLGASAGLNLAIDLYGYRWDSLEWQGQTSPAIVLETELWGRAPVPRRVEVLSRTGLDLHLVDATDPDDRRWLDALIWPEHDERRERLRAALAVAARVDMELVSGSALETLPAVLDRLSSDEPVVVMNSFTLNQFTRDQRSELDDVIEEARRRRPVARVSLEYSRGDDWPKLSIDDGLGPKVIGQGHPHGDWVELYALP
jgi:hypothetical protein